MTSDILRGGDGAARLRRLAAHRMPIERASSQYRQLADLLREAIVRGDYPPGSKFPSEPELAAEHKLSRPTVNRALLVLRAEGLIRVERGRGTIVRSVPTIKRHATTRYGEAVREQDGARGAFAAEIAGLRLEPRSDPVRVGRTSPPPDVREALELQAGEDVLIRKRHMYADETPVQLATSYIPWSIAEGTQLTETDTGPGGTYSRLAELGHAPVRFTERVVLRPPSSEEADFLGLSDELHIVEMHIVEIFHVALASHDRPVEVTIHVLPPHQWELHYAWPVEPPD
jgi:GntR family transcriptional regulator